MGELTHIVTGSPASFRSADKAEIKNLNIRFFNQDFNGYGHPWSFGGYLNMIPDGTDTSKGFVSDHYLDIDGVEQPTDGWIISEYFPVVAGETYTWGEGAEREETTKNAPCVCFYDSSKNFISAVNMNKVVSHTIVAPENAAYARSSSTTGTVPLQFIKGSVNKLYTPYSNYCPFSLMTGMKVYNDPALGQEIIWNQGYPGTAGTSATGGGVTFTFDGDGQWTLTGDGTATYRKQIQTVSTVSVGDILYFKTGANVAGSSSTFYVCFSQSGGHLTTSYAVRGSILKASYAYNQFSIRTFSGFLAPEEGIVLHPQWFNLTKMLGKETAEWMYDNMTKPEIIDWFINLFPEDYYPGNTGTVTNVSAVNNAPYTLVPVSWESLAGEIYGGSLNLITGELKKTHTVLTFDGTTSGKKMENKGTSTSYDNYYLPLSNASIYSGTKSSWVSADVLAERGYACSHTIIGTSTVLSDLRFAINAYVSSTKVLQPRLVFHLDEGIDTTSKCNAWLKEQYDKGTPVQLFYELKTPQTYQLDPIQLRSYLDHNNIFCDVNYTAEVEYAFVDRLAKRRMLMQKPDYNLFKLNVPFQNPDNTEVNASNKRIFTPKTYCIGNSFQNWFVPNNAGTNYSFDNNMIVFSPNRQDYGITFPIAVSGGEYYDLSFTPSENAKVAYAIYDASGGYLTGGVNMTGNVRLHMPDDAVITTLIFVSDVPNVQVTFSDIQFVKV